MAQIKLKDLTKEFDKGVVVIRDLDLKIDDGEFLVLVGPSGCGKSTTLRLIAGLEDITRGEIYIGDKMVNNIPPKDRDISMVFQNYALYPHMTVFDNMAFGLKLRKFKKQEIKERVEEAAEILEIRDLLNRKPKQLSGGQRQRVALGRAIVRKPSVFLFDEPLSNLDAKLRVQMRTEIKKLHKRLKTTMVYVTHDQVEAMTMGDRIAVMKDGIIHQVDDPLNLYNCPNDLFVAGFIGSPAMNFLHVKILDNGKLVADEGKIKVDIPDSHKEKIYPYIGKSIVLGIRPEDIFLEQQSKDSVKVLLNVEVFEPMGSETFIYFTTGKTPIVCRSAEFNPSRDVKDRLPVYFDMRKMYYFDTKSGSVIT
jgi:multiple sugar transport system ATP-binding protein